MTLSTFLLFFLSRNNVGREEDEIAAVLRLLHLRCLSLVLTFVSLPLPHQLAIWSKDVRDVRRGSDKSSELKRLTAAEAAAGSAAAALVGEGGDQGEEEAEEVAGKTSGEIISEADGGAEGNDSSESDTDIDCSGFR